MSNKKFLTHGQTIYSASSSQNIDRPEQYMIRFTNKSIENVVEFTRLRKAN